MAGIGLGPFDTGGPDHGSKPPLPAERFYQRLREMGGLVGADGEQAASLCQRIQRRFHAIEGT